MANKLAAWMHLEGIGATEVARKMGITQVHVWKIQHGILEASPSFAWKFGRAYGFELAVKLFESQTQKETA